MTFPVPSSISATLCLVLLHFLWQGALIAGAAWLVARVLRRHSAQVEYCCLIAGLLVMPLTVLSQQPLWLTTRRIGRMAWRILRSIGPKL